MHISQDIAKLRQFPTSWERSSALVPKPLPFVAKGGDLIPLVAACCDEIGQTAPCPEVGIPFAVDTA